MAFRWVAMRRLRIPRRLFCAVLALLALTPLSALHPGAWAHLRPPGVAAAIGAAADASAHPPLPRGIPCAVCFGFSPARTALADASDLRRPPAHDAPAGRVPDSLPPLSAAPARARDHARAPPLPA